MFLFFTKANAQRPLSRAYTNVEKNNLIEIAWIIFAKSLKELSKDVIRRS